MPSGIVGFIKHRPRTTNLLFSMVSGFSADLIQQQQEGNDVHDWARSGVFMGFNAVVSQLGFFVYVKTFPRLFPAASTFANHPTLRAKLQDKVGRQALAKQIALDIFGFTPFVYIPIFYTFKAMVQGGITSPVNAVSEGLSMYRSNFVSDNKMNLAVWIPGDILCFTVPIWLRMPVGHTINFLFITCLSALRGSSTTAARHEEVLSLTRIEEL